MFVYLAIGVSGVALLALGVGAAVKWRELFGKPQAAEAEVGVREPVSVPAPPALAPQAQTPQAPAPQPQLEHQQYPRPVTASDGPGRQPAAAGPGAAAAAGWGSAGPAAGMLPGVRPAGPGDTQRRPAAFTSAPAKAPVPAKSAAPAEVAVPAKAPAPTVA